MSIYGMVGGTEALRRVTGDLSQLAGVTPIEYVEGGSRGVRAYEVRTGGGLRFSVVLDRGMDIADAEAFGVPVGWRTGTGYVHPAFYDLAQDEWLRSYEGGLLTMGGLTQIGDPSEDRGEHLGLHGRIAQVPARECGYRVDWQALEIRIWGRLSELKPLTQRLDLVRMLVAPIGGTEIRIEDRVVNLGADPAPHQILYHMNVGAPLLSPESRLLVPARESFGWDEESDRALADHERYPGITDEVHVFGHRVGERDGVATAALVHPSLEGGMYAAIRFRPAELPVLWQWRSLRPHAYVAGIEPGLGHIRGRAQARAVGMLTELAPGEERRFHVALAFGRGGEALEAVRAEVAQQRPG